MSTYHFQPGERVKIANREPDDSSISSARRIGREGHVVKFLPASGLPDANGIKADRVRVKLDAWPRPLIFLARDVEPI